MPRFFMQSAYAGASLAGFVFTLLTFYVWGHAEANLLLAGLGYVAAAGQIITAAFVIMGSTLQRDGYLCMGAVDMGGGEFFAKIMPPILFYLLGVGLGWSFYTLVGPGMLALQALVITGCMLAAYVVWVVDTCFNAPRHSYLHQA